MIIDFVCTVLYNSIVKITATCRKKENGYG